MNHKQLSLMISILLKRAELELAECKHLKENEHARDNWIVHMVSATMCSAIADALMGARDALHD